MRLRTTAILALVVAVLAAFVYFYEIEGGVRREKAEVDKNLIYPDLNPADIDWIEIVTEDKHLARLQRLEEGGWVLESPFNFPADEITSEALASAIEDLVSKRVFDEPAPLADYGIEGEPRLKFGVEGRVFELRIGASSPIGDATYVASADTSRISLVDSLTLNPFKKKLKMLRDRVVVHFDRSLVDRVTLVWPDQRVVVVQDESGWRLREPYDVQADSQVVGDLLSELAFLRATDFVDEPGVEDSVSLASPELRVELSASENVIARVEIGGLAQDGRNRVVRVEGRTTLFLMPTSILSNFPRRPVEFRQLRLGEFSALDATQIELAFLDVEGGQTVSVVGRRHESGWNMSHYAMKAGVVSRMVAELAALKAEDVVAESLSEKKLEELGLNPPQVAVRISSDTGDIPLLMEIHLGNVDPDSGVVARRSDRDTVYLLSHDVGEEIPLSLTAFTSRFVEPNGTVGDTVGE